jgi:Zn-dependent peptidase ImmA (M78 family)
LHSRYLQFCIDEKVDEAASLSFSYNISDATTRQLEFQANLFASHLLLPKDAFLKVVSRYFRQENINKGFIYLDSQPTNKNLAFTLLNKISTHFEVSVEVGKIRLKTMGLLKDDTDISLFRILKEMGYSAS